MNTPEKLVIKDFFEGSRFENFRVLPNGALKRRNGYQLLRTLDATVRGAICVKEGTIDAIYAVAGNRLYKIIDNGTVSVTELGALSGVSFSDPDQRVEMFRFDKKIYILGGGSYNRYDGTSLSEVSGYVPIIRRNATPEDNGEVYEPINLLTNKVRMRFCPQDGIYHWKLCGIASSVESIYVNGSEYTSSYYLYENNSDSYIQLSNKIETNTDDIVEITYTLDQASLRSLITSCQSAVVYESEAGARVFLYGGEDTSVLYPSDLITEDASFKISAEYFPVNSEIVVGDGNEDVTGATKQGERLALFTSTDSYYTLPQSAGIVLGKSRTVFPIIPLKADIGAVDSSCVAAIGDEQFVMSETGLHRFRFSDLTKMWEAALLSAPEYVGLTPAFCNSCALYVNRIRKELWCFGKGSEGGRIAIYDTLHDLWYCFTAITPDFMFTFQGEPAFVKGNSIYCMSTDATTDCGAGIYAVYDSKNLDLGNAFDVKTMYEFGLSIEKTVGSQIIATLTSDKGESHTMLFGVTSDSGGDVPLILRSHTRLGHVSFVSFSLGLPPESACAQINEVMLRYRVL